MVTAIGALLWMIEVLGDFPGFGSEFRRRLQHFHHAPAEMGSGFRYFGSTMEISQRKGHKGQMTETYIKSKLAG